MKAQPQENLDLPVHLNLDLASGLNKVLETQWRMSHKLSLTGAADFFLLVRDSHDTDLPACMIFAGS